MKIISKEQLKAKLDRGDDFKLVMAMDRYAYEKMHIPGSLHFHSIEEAARQLDPTDEVIVYCQNPMCPLSIRAYILLRQRGFQNLYRYAEGLEGWYAAGYPLQGSLVDTNQASPERAFVARPESSALTAQGAAWAGR